MTISTATKHQFTIEVGTKEKKFKVSCNELWVLLGDELRWKPRGQEKFTIQFEDTGPFDLNPLPFYAAVEYRPTVRQGTFTYSVIDENHATSALDPMVVVDPPPYP